MGGWSQSVCPISSAKHRWAGAYVSPCGSLSKNSTSQWVVDLRVVRCFKESLRTWGNVALENSSTGLVFKSAQSSESRCHNIGSLAICLEAQIPAESPLKANNLLNKIVVLLGAVEFPLFVYGAFHLSKREES